MDEARERLRRWVDTHDSLVAVAKKLGCHPSYLSLLLRDGSTRRPGLDVAFAIERETREWPEGPVLASEWTKSTDELPDLGHTSSLGTAGAGGESCR